MEMILFFPFCRSTFNWRQEIPSGTSCETQEGPSWLWASFPRKKACPCRVRLRDGHPPPGQPARRSAWSYHKQHVFHSEPRTVHLLPTQKRWWGDQIASAWPSRWTWHLLRPGDGKAPARCSQPAFPMWQPEMHQESFTNQHIVFTLVKCYSCSKSGCTKGVLPSCFLKQRLNDATLLIFLFPSFFGAGCDNMFSLRILNHWCFWKRTKQTARSSPLQWSELRQRQGPLQAACPFKQPQRATQWATGLMRLSSQHPLTAPGQNNFSFVSKTPATH